MHWKLTEAELTRVAAPSTLLDWASSELTRAAAACESDGPRTPETSAGDPAALRARRAARFLRGCVEALERARPALPRSTRRSLDRALEELPADLTTELRRRGIGVSKLPASTAGMPLSKPGSVLEPLFDAVCMNFPAEAEHRLSAVVRDQRVEMNLQIVSAEDLRPVADRLEAAVLSYELGAEHECVLPLLLAAEQARHRGGDLEATFEQSGENEPWRFTFRLRLPILRGKRAISRQIEIGER